MRVLLFTGKGGVGKTSVSAATALNLAQRGYTTLVLSTDPAHSLGDIFATRITNRPTALADRLEGQEVTVTEALREYWSEVQEYLVDLFRAQGMDDISAEELAILPGFDELASVLYVEAYHREAAYDVVVVDTAPTGASLKLLSLPEMAQWYMQRVFKVNRALAKVARPLTRPFLKVPIPEDEVFRGVERLYATVERAKRLLQDPAVTTVRLVTNAEKMVIAETRRAYTYLSLYGYPVDALVVNRLLPPDTGAYMARWRVVQEENLRTIEESFRGLPILQAPMLEDEVLGRQQLERLATHLYGDRDPAEVFVEDRPFQVTRDPATGHVTIRMRAPFLEKEEVQLLNRGGVLVVEASNWRRVFTLPESVMDYEPVGAEFKDGALSIFLEEPAEAYQGSS